MVSHPQCDWAAVGSVSQVGSMGVHGTSRPELWVAEFACNALKVALLQI